MSLDAEAKGYKGVANWFFVQFKEEQDHARIFMNYLNSRDAKVELLPIEAVPSTWDSVLDMFKQTLEHEKKVTALIHNLAVIANDMIAATEAVEGNKYGMYMLDKELAARTYNTPSPLATAE